MSADIAPIPDINRDPFWRSQADQQLRISGVAIDADPAELRMLGTVTAILETCLHSVYGEVDSAVFGLEASAVFGSTAIAQAQCRSATLRLRTAIHQTHHLADALQAASDEYEQAEQQVSLGLAMAIPRLSDGPLAPLFGEVDLLVAWNRLFGTVAANALLAALNGQWTPGAAGTGEIVEELSWLGTGGPMLDWFGFDGVNRNTLLALVLARAGAPLSGAGTDVTVTKVEPTNRQTTPTKAATGTEDLAHNIGEFRTNDELPDGSVRVDKVTDAAGNVSWQVSIPGTETAHNGLGLPDVDAYRNENPFDWESNLLLYAGQPAASMKGVIDAMRQAGVKKGEPVLLAGHSQSSMIAMAIANDESLNDEFTIGSVVTFGGPTGHMETPEGVPVLHVEHSEDLVVGLPSVPNPVAENRFTVQRALAESELVADAGVDGVWDSHDLPAYARTGKLIDASADPVLANWRAQSASVFPTGTVTTETSYFQVRRNE